jgi:hypothetical protein
MSNFLLAIFILALAAFTIKCLFEDNDDNFL